MKRKNQNPEEYSRKHTQERALERYGYVLTKDGYDHLCNVVRAEMVRRCFPKGKPQFTLVNQEGTQSTLIVPFKGQTFVVVFDAGRSLVTTVLPPEHFKDIVDPEIWEKLMAYLDTLPRDERVDPDDVDPFI